MAADSNPSDPTPRSGLLEFIERAGNRLPDPTTLFLIGTLVVMGLSEVAARGGWEVLERLPRQKTEAAVDDEGSAVSRPVLGPDGRPQVEWVETGKSFTAVSLLTRDGLFWAIRSLVPNFMNFPPLGVVLVGMLGIGIAERTGLIAALLKAFLLVVPSRLLTPAMVFIGIQSSMAVDAGYVVLPPVAAALYLAAGRSPLAGLAAVFAGVSAGFNANLLITGLDPMLAGFSTAGARTIDPDYSVAATCNWWFLAVSTAVITLTGWGVTAWFVERRLSRKPPELGGPPAPGEGNGGSQGLDADERRGLLAAAAAFAAALGVLIFLILWPQGALHGQGERFDRWVEAIVPMLFVSFLVPGMAYGVAVGKIRSDKDAARLLIESMAAMAPIIVLAFFAAQFIEYFKYSGLDRMLASAGGQALGRAELPAGLLLTAFILVTLVFNLFIGSMSAKYALFAPIFIPMFMMVGISPELTQAAYRIGDSVSNIITPLNPYLVIILVFMQKHVPRGGMGTLISTMLPYTVCFALVWIALLLLWLWLGIPLGPEGALTYSPF